MTYRIYRRGLIVHATISRDAAMAWVLARVAGLAHDREEYEILDNSDEGA
jgi:hypothetical protein